MVRPVRKPYHLLIADDDADFRGALRSLFEPYFVLMEAESGEEAVELAERHPVHVALLDMHMRILTGLETLKLLKARHGPAPCILITADATDELRRDAVRADAFSVLAKPVSRSKLMDTVSQALQAAYHDAGAFSLFRR